MSETSNHLRCPRCGGVTFEELTQVTFAQPVTLVRHPTGVGVKKARLTPPSECPDSEPEIGIRCITVSCDWELWSDNYVNFLVGVSDD